MLQFENEDGWREMSSEMINNFTTASMFKDPDMRRSIAVNKNRGDQLFEGIDFSHLEDGCHCPESGRMIDLDMNPDFGTASPGGLCTTCYEPRNQGQPGEPSTAKYSYQTFLLLMNRGTEIIGPYLDSDYCLLAVPIACKNNDEIEIAEVKATQVEELEQQKQELEERLK